MLLYINYPSWIHTQVFSGIPIYWYGLMYIFAFIITYLLFQYQVKKGEIDVEPHDVLTMFLWIVISAFIMSRIFATTVYDPTGRYMQAPWLIFWPFDDNMGYIGFRGMNFFGGIIGGIVGAILWSLRYRKNLLHWLDAFVHCIPLGYTLGQVGHFINAELYGSITALPIGIVFPNAKPVSIQDSRAREIIERLDFPLAEGQLAVNLPRHPSQFYEALAAGIVLWIVLWFLVRPRRPFHGFSSSFYLIYYGVVRFLVEFSRDSYWRISFYNIFTLNVDQIFSFFCTLFGVLIMLILIYKHRRRPRIETFNVPETGT